MSALLRIVRVPADGQRNSISADTTWLRAVRRGLRCTGGLSSSALSRSSCTCGRTLSAPSPQSSSDWAQRDLLAVTSESWSSDNERLANSRSPKPSSPTTTTGPQRLALNPVTGRGCGRWTRPDVGHSFARGARMKVTPCCAVRVECAVCGVRGASPCPSGYDG